MGWLGSRQAVRELVEAHYAGLYRYAYRLTGSAADAEDITQEAFCKAQAQLGQLREPGRAKPWLYSIARNAYLHRLRSDRTRREVPLEAAGDLPDAGPDLPPEVEPERLQQALNELPEGQRTPIILYYFDDFSYRDIADHMSLPIGTVMSRLARAKAWLRERLTAPVGADARGGGA